MYNNCANNITSMQQSQFHIIYRFYQGYPFAFRHMPNTMGRHSVHHQQHPPHCPFLAGKNFHQTRFQNNFPLEPYMTTSSTVCQSYRQAVIMEVIYHQHINVGNIYYTNVWKTSQLLVLNVT
jgi:hypothetical protein